MLPSLLGAVRLFYVNIHLLDRVVVCSVWGGARCLTSCHAALGDRMRGGGAWPLRCPWHTGDTVLTTAGAGAGPFPERPPGGVPSALPSPPPGSGGHPRGPGGGGLGEGVRPCAGAAGVRVVEWLAGCGRRGAPGASSLVSWVTWRTLVHVRLVPAPSPCGDSDDDSLCSRATVDPQGRRGPRD